MQGVHLRKYGVQAVFNFELYEVDGVDLRVDAADGGSDCTLMKDQGAPATCDNDFVDEGSLYSITLTATEMEFAQGNIYIVDSATKVWLDKVIHIETYGNASAQHAMDLDEANGTQFTEAGATGNHLTAIPWNAAWDAEVESECADALVAIDLDHLLSVADADDVADNSVIARLADSGATADWSDFVQTTDSLRAMRDHIGDGTNLTEAGATGNHLSAIPWNAAWDAEVQSEVDDALVARDLDHLVNVADADDVADDSIMGKLAASDGDWSGYDPATDSLEAVRDHVGDGTNLPEAGGDGDHLTAIPATVDWLNGGRLDLILDIIAADTTTDIPALIATAQADLDVITGASGVVIQDASITAASYAAGANDAAAQATDAVTEIANGLMDLTAAIDGYTPRQVLAIILAMVAGVVDDAATTTPEIKNHDDSEARVDMTTDGDGNRSGITYSTGNIV